MLLNIALALFSCFIAIRLDRAMQLQLLGRTKE